MKQTVIVRRADNAVWVALVGNVIIDKGSLEYCEALAVRWNQRIAEGKAVQP